MNLTKMEILSQYKALRKTYDYMLSKQEVLRACYVNHRPSSLTFIGSGSGYCLARSGEMMAQMRIGSAARSVTAGDLMMNFAQYEKMVRGSMFVALSRSGSTSELLYVLETLKESGGRGRIGIVAKAASEIAPYLDICLEIPWAFDQSVCQTRCVSNLYMAMLMLVSTFSGQMEICKEIDRTINSGDAFMRANRAVLEEIAAYDFDRVFLLADGESQGIASEGAMAFMEIAGVPAHSFNILDVRHGPMILVNERTLVISYMDQTRRTLRECLIEDIHSRGAKQLVFTLNDHRYEKADWQIGCDMDLPSAVGAIPFLFLAQWLAVSTAEKKGLNPDNPKGLVSWVKL